MGHHTLAPYSKECGKLLYTQRHSPTRQIYRKQLHTDFFIRYTDFIEVESFYGDKVAVLVVTIEHCNSWFSICAIESNLPDFYFSKFRRLVDDRDRTNFRGNKGFENFADQKFYNILKRKKHKLWLIFHLISLHFLNLSHIF